MEEERVGPQDGGKTTTSLSVEEAEPEIEGPPFGGEFDPVPAAGFDYDDIILALAFFNGAPEQGSAAVLGDELEESLADDEDAEVYDDGGSSGSESEEGNDDAAAGSDDNDLVVSRNMTTFLGQPARFASYQGTAGFMRISFKGAAPPRPTPAGAGQDAGGGGGFGVIVVHYRYYRFSKPRGGGPGVEAPHDYRTDLHHVRFLLPRAAVAADPAAALRLAGASLAADAYPYRAHARLQALWSALLAAAPVRVPPGAGAAQLVVTVDVGALRVRRADRTPELVEYMRAALLAEAREVDASPPIFGQEQRLPAPVRGGGGGGEGEGGVPRRPAKRRRVGDAAAIGEDTGEVCAICCEVMLEHEQGLAAWPRCNHVFHGRCLEQLLATVRHRCPLCRSTLSIREVC